MFWYVQAIGHQLLIGEGPTYGYRRITALFRIMRQNGMLLARHTGRRNGRLHDGKVVGMGSDLR